MKSYLNWSSGKDAAFALYTCLQNQQKPELLLTSVNTHYQRVSMHGLRVELLEAQAEALDIPLEKLELPENPNMDEYNHLMKSKVESLVKRGFTHSVFGDIFLEDLKKYRENMLAPYGIQCLFPLWKKDTKALVYAMLEAGFRAVIVCLDASKLDPERYLGKELTVELVESFPENVDPCGENGEFHTFCFGGPLFKHSLPIVLGEVKFRSYPNPTEKDSEIRFAFQDILLKEKAFGN